MEERLDPGTLPTTILHRLEGGACLTIDTLETSLGLTRRQISDGAAKLVLRGLLERIEAGCYRLTAAGRDAAASGLVITSGPRRPHTAKVPKPARNTFRQRVWTALRMSGAVTVGDLVMAAAGSDDLDAESNAAWYLCRLRTAGYIAELPVRQKGTRPTSNGFKRYRLILDTGPQAPVYRPKTRSVHDYNTGKDMPCAIQS